MDIDSALRQLIAKGQTTIRANQLADLLWPNARHNNARGQVFNLASGVAGKMLARHKGVIRRSVGTWEIVSARLKEKT
jgi:hypothetical protein